MSSSESFDVLTDNSNRNADAGEVVDSLSEYFNIYKGTPGEDDPEHIAVERTDAYQTLDRDYKVLAAVLLGEFLHDEIGVEAGDVFQYVHGSGDPSVKDSSGRWNCYSVLRHLEKKGVLRWSHKQYFVAPRHFDETLDSLA